VEKTLLEEYYYQKGRITVERVVWCGYGVSDKNAEGVDIIFEVTERNSVHIVMHYDLELATSMALQ
jgi:hypothetical protein